MGKLRIHNDAVSKSIQISNNEVKDGLSSSQTNIFEVGFVNSDLSAINLFFDFRNGHLEQQ